nr:hypothetical protein [Lachnospiraceae bacterium]
MREIKTIKVNNKIFISIFFILLYFTVSGFFFDKVTVELDTEKTIVYQNESADVVVKAFEDSSKTAEKNYSNNYLLLYGTVISKSDDNKKFVIGKKSGKKNINCKTADKALIEEISKINENDSVKVYGRLTLDFFGNINLDMDKLETSGNNQLKSSLLTTIDGKTFDKEKALIRGTGKNNDTIFYIPNDWKAVEHDIKKEGISKIPGYQYKLNELGKKEAYAESFFICCIDKESIVADKDDINENELIEKAILKDIFKKTDSTINKFPAKKVKTYYGSEYKYYKDTFTKELTGDSYRVEVIFQEKDEEILMYIY